MATRHSATGCWTAAWRDEEGKMMSLGWNETALFLILFWAWGLGWGFGETWKMCLAVWHAFYMLLLGTHTDIYPPRPIRALGAGVIILDNYIINMITCSKTLQIPVKNASWMHMTLSILTFQKEKLQFPETRIWLWKGSIFSSNCKPFAWKMHLTLQKAAWEAKNAICVKNICKQ